MKKIEYITLLGVTITNETSNEILQSVITKITKNKEKFFIVTPNPEIIAYAYRNREFLTTLNKAEFSLCDGAGLYWTSKFLGTPLRERVTGVDMMKLLCKQASEHNLKVALLGGKKGVAEKTKDCLEKDFPNLDIVLATTEWEYRYNLLSIDILFVAFGFPKQEDWMESHLSNSHVRVMMGVGGAFDYISGTVLRAPVWVRNIGFEWFYRLVMQPWRLKRQIEGSLFFFLVFKEKFFNSH